MGLLNEDFRYFWVCPWLLNPVSFQSGGGGAYGNVSWFLYEVNLHLDHNTQFSDKLSSDKQGKFILFYSLIFARFQGVFFHLHVVRGCWVDGYSANPVALSIISPGFRCCGQHRHEHMPGAHWAPSKISRYWSVV